MYVHLVSNGYRCKTLARDQPWRKMRQVTRKDSGEPAKQELDITRQISS